MRRVVGITGRVLVSAGALLLLFVAYQLWGTGLLQARAQDDLRSDLSDLRAATTTTAPAGPRARPVSPEPGDALGILRIPAIGLDVAFVEGTGRDELARGPGHYPHSPLPGHRGNAALAGHRATYGAPFARLDELRAGDVIEAETLEGTFRYRVDGTSIVSPRDVEPVLDRGDDRITLTTCHPRYSARQRLVVTGTLAGRPVDAPPRPVRRPAPRRLDAASAAGLAAPTWATVAWGLLLAAVGAAWWWAARRRPGWWARLGGVLPFLVVLFFVFGEVERMLPADF